MNIYIYKKKLLAYIKILAAIYKKYRLQIAHFACIPVSIMSSWISARLPEPRARPSSAASGSRGSGASGTERSTTSLNQGTNQCLGSESGSFPTQDSDPPWIRSSLFYNESFRVEDPYTQDPVLRIRIRIWSIRLRMQHTGRYKDILVFNSMIYNTISISFSIVNKGDICLTNE